MIHVSARFVLIAAGWISLALGLIGILLPVLPTTPFVILAAFLFSKGSPRLHGWLVSRPYLGRLVLDWERHGVIRKPADSKSFRRAPVEKFGFVVTLTAISEPSST